jgi:putative ABC transport system permease protein
MLLAIIRQALATMGQHRRWAALTMFGIVWGTASVVLLVGWGVGVQGMVDVGLQKVGKNLVFVIPGRVGEDLSPADERRVITFDLDDVEAARASSRYAELVGAEVELWQYVRNGGRGRVADVRGIEPTMQQLRA